MVAIGSVQSTTQRKTVHGHAYGRGKRRCATDRQWAVLQFIISYTEDRGYPPCTREICKAFRFASTNAAGDHLRALQRKGYIAITPNVARGIRVLGRE